jgi:poly-gamma-glutamate biosynthesis protein PgsC/CapC
VASTVLVGLVTYAIIKLISHYILLYGRRLLIICILLGYLMGYAVRLFPALSLTAMHIDITTIGYVVPGLIAYWMHRQGIIETISAMVIVSIMVRLIVIVISGGAISG